ncbi:aminotransferase class V-fold PLP-dependent enzyme [Phaeobacter gallaeciensis]|jgi:selenocysteine lyase/cysteine desulfurase|uniref:aminotransferase class V-fold PLP-dependent enzyme n=1 Tax=Phaeobacter gallaeciensis TaxID=60890 RepID=UPI00237F0852|nr:aminotransferase class V-fold PLP-dependent enzyme [Phaeobacter gallaeciensis]MDE4305326.1 aminotransferase class V-fold PLP-dependent enzyme [Phaeobacter gallaeciensis]MDE4309674.1 aminotransferase class V-fold PLP-dependent enzyme [Phaeobacter gallaeciensis]MDE4314003.1 aminotransferase class V-fold PLP-dependent enzyme [Phaeobacter gallaeciensis]MDE4318603.1 aminotransferase class V-fold PLP-dependent enzyme [Phaeobacter gallaeciensis]MDE4322637.1 aminotransferase class V-fold PLP-depend
MILATIKQTLKDAAREGRLADELIGEGVQIPGADGMVPLVYADYVASGRALRSVEDFIVSDVLPFYANSHTEASYCGAHMTRLRRAARAEIARITGARQEDAVIFAGAGATAGLNRLVSLLGVNEARAPVVFIGPYEHHSNILPWRESRATVVEIPEAAEGGPDLEVLQVALREYAACDLKIGSFSVASNVTGILTDADAVSDLLHAHGALAVWDYAGGGPYLPIDMGGKGGARKDAVVVSPHKFPGGPGASGVLIVNGNAVRRKCPSWPGGGTVSFVSPWDHAYSADLAAREEAGTPNVIGDIRAALAFLVKEAVGEAEIARREARFGAMAREGWQGNPQLTLLGHPTAPRLPVFSFTVRGASGRPVHQQLFTRMLSDFYGIQARGGCACAGPYAHRLLDIDAQDSNALFADLQAGKELRKPGWVRLNFSYLMRDETARYIIDSVNDLALRAENLAARYEADPTTARFQPRAA